MAAVVLSLGLKDFLHSPHPLLTRSSAVLRCRVHPVTRYKQAVYRGLVACLKAWVSKYTEPLVVYAMPFWWILSM